MRARSVQAVWGIGLLVGAVWACETTRNPGGIQRDLTPPTLTLTNTAGDTQAIAGGLRFTVRATDNLGLKSIDLLFAGGHIDTTDTVFTSTVTTYNVARTISFPSGSGAGGLVQVIGIASDGAGNVARDTLFIFLSNVSALQVTLVSPATGAVASTGLGIPVEVVAVQREGIRKIGFLVTPPGAVNNPTVPPSDSIVYTQPYADSVSYVDTLVVLATVGTFTVVGFAEDSSGRRSTTTVVTVTVMSAANDNTPPVVSHTVGARVEVDDSVIIHATDPSGILWIGLELRRASNNTLLRFDSTNVGGTLSDVTRRFSLNLAGLIPPDSVPYGIVVRSYACDAAIARNCAFSVNSTVIQSPSVGGGPGAMFRAPGTDTIVVVSGVTTPFPRRSFPTRISDAIFNANLGELYLTNTTNDLVEIFQVGSLTFVPGGIPKAGPQPWGIAMWPADVLGNYINRIVVANAGGTQLAIMDAATRLPLWRQDLPDFIIQTYRVVTVGGFFNEEIVEYNVSDRPQYVGTVCRPAGGTACDADSVFAIYSTTPTVSSPAPFTGRATLRMEKLTPSVNPLQQYGHLFWEIATEGPSLTNDTLRIRMRRGRNQDILILTACHGQTVDLGRIGLGDSTFVRNSGDFTHALVGEGGTIAEQFARAMSYTTNAPLQQGAATFTTCFTSPDTLNGPIDAGENHVDFGISPGVEVRDFIANTGVGVSAIATNFNGATNVVRADSLYYLDEALRLKAASAAPVGSPGMDMNYNHDFAPSGSCAPTCGGTGNSNNRIIFVAQPDGTIGVFDTYFGYLVGSIAVRDAIFGPLRVARDATGTIQYLFGVTSQGIVTVQLPAFSNPPPAPPRRWDR